ncbi:MerR family transcriptional regulator [Halobacillus salinarum]|uniref:MerR family transcriptional regulator n=1 Tax=Halobacillus salinarum TaxID=2932257 RepID=A0ABY4EFS0_9BACI|nr:MerR family transcriptional regulator [Halobacillus salinarum]UOQ43314.1 MerR family transcriptional regulator [Halobacillus salinarum]
MAEYKIDEVARKSGLTKRTIRYYEEIGLLFPAARTDGGYRTYNAQHINRLNQIVNAREVLGISLEEVRDFVEIREEVSLNLEDIKQTQDTKVKLEKLYNFKKILEREREMVHDKLKKIQDIKDNTDDYYHRVCKAIANYEKE